MQPEEDKRFVDQSLTALRLTVVEGDLDFEQFDILQEDALTLRSRGVVVQCRIIGASHVISVIYGDRQFHEIVACVGVREAEGIALSSLNDQPATIRLLDGTSYSIMTKTVPWDAEESAEFQALLGAVYSSPLLGGVALHQEFPQGDLPGIPRTVVVAPPVLPEETAIRIGTAHSYPGEGTVFTYTEMEVQ